MFNLGILKSGTVPLTDRKVIVNLQEVSYILKEVEKS